MCSPCTTLRSCWYWLALILFISCKGEFEFCRGKSNLSCLRLRSFAACYFDIPVAIKKVTIFICCSDFIQLKFIMYIQSLNPEWMAPPRNRKIIFFLQTFTCKTGDYICMGVLTYYFNYSISKGFSGREVPLEIKILRLGWIRKFHFLQGLQTCNVALIEWL